MNIIIVGVGDIGFYLASVMSQKGNDVTVIDVNSKKLESVSRDMDVATRLGSGTDWRLLDEFTESSPGLLLALTESDETNLVICAIARNLGYAKTIARVRDDHYFNQTRLDLLRLFHVDHYICPELLAAHDIVKQISLPGSINVQSFAHGAIYMRTIEVPLNWHKGNKKLHELNLPNGLILGLIVRKDASGQENVIFPHGQDSIYPGDEVTFIGETEEIENIHHFLGCVANTPKTVVLIGANLVGYHVARLLSKKGIHVRLIDSDYELCCRYAELLPEVTVLNQLETDVHFLESEGVEKADYFIACAKQDEVNLLACMLAKKVGCQKIIATTATTRYASIIKDLGITYTVSPRNCAVNRILSLVQAESVSSMVSMYDNQAEIMEIRVPLDSQIAGIPLATLGPLLPQNFLIAVIQNRGRILIANGDRILSPGDTVIAISNPKHVKDLNKLF